MYKKILAAVLCAGMLLGMQPVYAQQTDTQQTDIQESIEEQITKAINELSADSAPEELEHLRLLLESWKTEQETEGQEDASLSGTMIGTGGIGQGTINAGGSNLQAEFAKLQAQLAQSLKKDTAAYLEKIQEMQGNQTQITKLIAKLNDFKATLKGAEKVMLPSGLAMDFAEYVGGKNLALLQKPIDKDGVADLILLAENRVEELSSQIQSQMVYLQNYVGQYNSYTQGAGQAIGNAGGAARGGTMLDANKGMLFTGLLTGAVGGVLGVLLVQRAGKKKS